jgi:hypothetical protein
LRDVACPHCHKALTIDEAGYADIVAQVRTKEFDAALAERLHLAERDKRTAVELAKTQAAAELERASAGKGA